MAKSILDPTFKYVPSVETDLRKTFARIRKEQREAEEKRKADARKVVEIKQASLRG